MIRRVAFAIVVVLSGAAALAQDEGAGERSAKLSRLKTVVPRIEAMAFAKQAFGRCPAEHFGSRSSVATRIGKWFAGVEGDATDEAICLKAPDACAELCELSDGAACADLARAVEGFADELDQSLAVSLFAAACEMGDASGCTNRGSYLSDAREWDAMRATSEDERDACAFRLFAIACDRDDPWGCTMRGRALGSGEGTPVDLPAARRALERACTLAPRSDPCRSARGTLDFLTSER